MKPKPYNKYMPVLLIIALAFALRLWNVIAIGDGFYANFLSDASTYRLWASKIAAGSSYTEPAFPMGPLYPYFLALCLNVGFTFYAALFLQIIFGTIVVYNIYTIGSRIFDKKAGLISAFMAAIYAPFVFYDGILLSESLQLVLISFALLLIIPSKGKKYGFLKYLVSGMLIGLAALGRATILLFPLLVAVYRFYKFAGEKRERRKQNLGQAAAIVMGAILGVMPAAIHNLSNGELVPISSNFGINLYIGNNAEAQGTYDEPRGLNLSSDFTGRQIAERESGRKLKGSEVSGFWSNRAFKFMKENPSGFLLGLLKKGWLYFWYFDIPQAESIQIQHRFCPAFRILPAGYWFVLVPGFIGIFLSVKNDSWWLLLLLLISSIAGSMMFFVIGRFKLIGAIALLIFSGRGIFRVYKSLKEKNKPVFLRVVAIIVCALFLLFLPRPIDRDNKIASAFDNVGISHFFKNEPEQAIEWYREAIEIKPSHSGALNNIGGYFYTKQNQDSAIYYFHRSIQSDSTDDKAYQNLGRTFLNTGMPDSAFYYYQKAKMLSPFGTDADKALKELELLGSNKTPGQPSFDALFGLAEEYAGRRQFDLAEAYYKRALELKPGDIRALNNLGFAFQALGKLDSSVSMFSRVIELTGGSAIGYNNLASVIYRIGLADSAVALWEKALKFDPENTQIKKNLDFVKGSRNK